MTYEEKIDQYRDLDPEVHQRIVQQKFKEIEEENMQKKEQEIKEKIKEKKLVKDHESDLDDSDVDDMSDEDEEAAELKLKNPKKKLETQNLRQRGDIPKYLQNSTNYDGKSRAALDEDPNTEIAIHGRKGMAELMD